MNKYLEDTWVDSEEVCTDVAQFRRKFHAIHYKTKKMVTGRAAIPDTFFSMPATTATEDGFLTLHDNVLVFIPHLNQSRSPAEYRKECRQRCK